MNLDRFLDRFESGNGRVSRVAWRRPDWTPGVPGDVGFRPAAVLVAVVDRPEGATIVLTRRNDELPDHPGQVSFPGGRIEPEDTSPEDAALREAEEEIALSRDRVRLIGRLDEYRTGTGFAITPVVGVARPPLGLSPDPREVASVFEVPLAFSSTRPITTG